MAIKCCWNKEKKEYYKSIRIGVGEVMCSNCRKKYEEEIELTKKQTKRLLKKIIGVERFTDVDEAVKYLKEQKFIFRVSNDERIIVINKKQKLKRYSKEDFLEYASNVRFSKEGEQNEN